jgi:hypothetical protein
VEPINPAVLQQEPGEEVYLHRYQKRIEGVKVRERDRSTKGDDIIG